jgi:hypothetical protein
MYHQVWQFGGRTRRAAQRSKVLHSLGASAPPWRSACVGSVSLSDSERHCIELDRGHTLGQLASRPGHSEIKRQAAMTMMHNWLSLAGQRVNRSLPTRQPLPAFQTIGTHHINPESYHLSPQTFTTFCCGAQPPSSKDNPRLVRLFHASSSGHLARSGTCVLICDVARARGHASRSSN